MNCTSQGNCSSNTDILAAQLLSLVSLFAGMLVTLLLPYWCATRSPEVFNNPRYNLVLSLANCFSGGVFVATFFVGLMPEVRELFHDILEAQEIHTSYPITEFVIFFGFFLALLTEQLALEYRERKSITDRRERNYSIKSTAESDQQFTKSDEEGHSENEEHSLSSRSSEAEFSEQHSIPSENATKGKGRHYFKIPTQENSGVDGESCNHGHSHANVGNLMQQEKGIRFVILMLSLAVHSLFEGLALGLQTSTSALFNLFTGVTVHELLVAFAMGISMSRLRLPSASVVRFAVVFCLAIPSGQIIGLAVGSSRSASSQVISAVLQGLAAGTFIHVTFLEIIPAELHDKNHRLLKVLFLFFGFAMLLGCTILLKKNMSSMH